MQYLLTFLEGIISFISPCMLPMLPVYITYFGGKTKTAKTVFIRALLFVAGFSLVFALLGLFAGSIGMLLVRYRAVFNIICGIIIIFFGLSYLEVFNIPFFKGIKNMKGINGLFEAFLFGMIYSFNLTPCVGAFLGAALVQASNSASAFSGMLLLISYSLGLGIPFLLSAILIDRLGITFGIIKRNYKIINIVCGVFLIVVGIMMCFGILGKMISFFTIGQVN